MTDLQTRCVEAMADAALADLLDRGGIQQMLEEIKYGDPETWKDIREAVGAAARLALLSELDAAGWQVVPREATPEMVTAALDRPADPDAIMYGPIYRAMCAAAPKPFKEDKS